MKTFYFKGLKWNRQRSRPDRSGCQRRKRYLPVSGERSITVLWLLVINYLIDKQRGIWFQPLVSAAAPYSLSTVSQATPGRSETPAAMDYLSVPDFHRNELETDGWDENSHHTHMFTATYLLHKCTDFTSSSRSEDRTKECVKKKKKEQTSLRNHGICGQGTGSCGKSCVGELVPASVQVKPPHGERPEPKVEAQPETSSRVGQIKQLLSIAVWNSSFAFTSSTRLLDSLVIRIDSWTQWEPSSHCWGSASIFSFEFYLQDVDTVAKRQWQREDELQEFNLIRNPIPKWLKTAGNRVKFCWRKVTFVLDFKNVR